MASDSAIDKKFDGMERRELEGYARDFGIPGYEAMSDTELRKRIKDVDGGTGVVGESPLPTERRGDPGGAPRT